MKFVDVIRHQDDPTVVRSPSGPPAPAGAEDPTVMPPGSSPPAAEPVAQAPPGPLPAGERLREFLIRSVIGTGGFGIVYLAHDESLDRDVALKEYLPQSLAYRAPDAKVRVKSHAYLETFAAGLRSFVLEAQELARRDHPALVKVHTFWEANGTAYMVMPYYKGPTLKEYLATRSSAPDERWWRAILAPLLEVLEMLHADGLCHRDIAPDNILLVGGQAPVLLDFGAARRVVTGAKPLTVILKPSYAPIEQYDETGGMRQGPWTDLYALAAVVYAAIVEKPPPAPARAVHDTLRPASAACRGQFSEAFLRAIDAALAVRPEGRPQSVEAFRALMGPAPVEVPPVRAPSAKLKRGWSVAAALAVLVLGAVLWRILLPGGGSSDAPAPPAPAAREAAPAPTPSPPELQASPAPATALPASGTASAAPSVAAAAPSIAAAAPAPADPLQALHAARDPAMSVQVEVKQPRVRINRDKLRFSVTSSHAGYVYAFMRGTADELTLMFPNGVDGNNRISAGKRLDLPRPGWELTAGGPPGTDRFVLMVSEAPRDFRHLRPRVAHGFMTFRPEALAAAGGASALAGRTRCGEGAPCSEAYGSAVFEFTEVP